jgi:hypothetical protein
MQLARHRENTKNWQDYSEIKQRLQERKRKDKECVYFFLCYGINEVISLDHSKDG